MAHVRDRPPLRQHIEAITPTGRCYRWGDDEPLAENVFSDLRHSSTMPGGYESMEVSLPRKSAVDYSDLERLTTLRIIGAGGQVDGEYRLEGAPRTSGDQMAITPSAVGWQAHLEDDESAQMVYRDRDLSHFSEMQRARRISIVAGAADYQPHAIANDEGTGLPALQIGLVGAWARQALCETNYLAPAGVTVARLRADWVANASINTADPLWLADAFATSDGITLFDQTSGDFLSAASGTLTYTPGIPRRGFMLRVYYNTGPAGADGTNYFVFFRNVAVDGNHGLTLRGTEPDAGFYASDIVGHAVATWAPLLQVKSDSIQQSGFIIPHMVFLEPTTAGEIVRQASRFNLPDWAVWADKEFVWHAQGARGKRWRARIGPSQLDETGPQIDRLWESIIVQYQDVDGTVRTVGPPGSGANAEDIALKDSDPENPANQLGVTRRHMLVIGVSVSEAAIEAGRQFLEQTKLLDRAGRAQLVGWVEDDRGIMYPYSRVRAGDYISFTDASDTSYRRIVRADHTRSSRSCSIDLDAPPDGLAQLLERWGAVLVPLGL